MDSPLTMRPRRLLQFLALFALWLLKPPLVLAFDAQTVARDFEQQFRAGAAEHDYPAAALAIVSRKRILTMLTLGHLDATRQRPADERTIFRLASVSKTFAAGAVGLLTNEGALAWDDPVAAFQPGFNLRGDSHSLRLRHLLEHSSGLIPHAYDNLIEDGVARDEVVRQLMELEPLCSPGHCYGYQNVLFSLLEPAVEQATALPYQELVRRRIFEPLAMRDASLGFEAFTANPNHARPHVRGRGAWRPVPVAPHYYHLPAAAGVNASISDMARWLQAQLGANPEVLSPELVAYLTTPRQRTTRQLRRRHWRDMLSDAHYGMGWRVYDLNGLRVVYHGGWVEGFRADLAFAPALDLGIAILINAEANTLSELSARFWELARGLPQASPSPGP